MINNAPSITPLNPNGLIIVATGVGQGPFTGFASGAPATALFMPVTYPGETDLDTFDNADGYAHNYYGPILTQQNYNWTLPPQVSNSWNAAAVEFKADNTTLPPPNCTPASTTLTEPGATGTMVLDMSGTAPLTVSLVAAVLPGSRSVQVGCPATAFVTIINAGAATATAVGIFPQSVIPASFMYQTTNPLTNAVAGKPNTPMDIAPGQFATYVVAITPTAPFGPIEVAFAFAGSNTVPVETLVGINTILLSGSATPTPDIVALAATLNNDGIVDIPGATGTGFSRWRR